MPSREAVMPYDIILTTLGSEHRDIDSRMYLAQSIGQDAAGREVHRLFDCMGNASSKLKIPAVRGTTYPAVTLLWDRRSPLKSLISIGDKDMISVDAWMTKAPGSRPCRAFVGSDGHTYTWTQVERSVWNCTNEMGYIVSEGTDDENRTITVDQNRPWLGVEIFISFYIMYRLCMRV